MKKVAAFIIVLVLFSCSPKEEIRTPVMPPPPREIPPVAMPVPPVVVPPIIYKEQIRCDDNTRDAFNRCGIDVLPFLRPLFFDVDNDGKQEMIAGSKDGTLLLYRNVGSPGALRWELVPRYFEGITAGAFAAPAIADIDNDGKPEVLVGTGGFSSDSGRVIIYRNAGTLESPVWQKVEHPDIRVGNDATPVLFDVDGDGKPDLVVGNSIGRLTLFRNRSDSRGVRFEKDAQFFAGVTLGMYVVPSVAVHGNKLIIIAGNSEGRLFTVERERRAKTAWHVRKLKIIMPNFAAPALIATEDPAINDLVISDGDGQLYYFSNRQKNYEVWEEVPDYFSGRILAGQACAPSMVDREGRQFLVTGNINGRMKFFEHDAMSRKLPWKERGDYFGEIKLHGYARGVMTTWQGKDLLIAGQQDGLLRAFVDTGGREKPRWKELHSFFKGIPLMMHPAPAVFDLDGDGKWDLILGDVNGKVRGFRYSVGPSGMPQWEEMGEIFRNVYVGRFSTPVVFEDGGKLFLLAGQQNGKIRVFSAVRNRQNPPVFEKYEDLVGVGLDDHSSPSVLAHDGVIALAVGNYNGGLRYFACKREQVEIKGN